MAETALTVPAFIAKVSKILAARRLARGQSHDAHALDGRIEKARHFALKAGREGRVVAGARNPAPKGGTSLRLISWRDRDSGTDHSTASPFTSAP